jgi:hypothetical protein
MIIVVEESEGGAFRASIATVPGVVAIEEDHPDPGTREGRTPGEALERVGTLVDRELARAGWMSITTTADVDDLVEGTRPAS